MDLTTDATVAPEALSRSSHSCLLGNGRFWQVCAESAYFCQRDIFLVARFPIIHYFRAMKLGVIVLLSPFDLESASEGFMF